MVGRIRWLPLLALLTTICSILLARAGQSAPSVLQGEVPEVVFADGFEALPPENAAPQVEAGSDQSISLPASANLSGSVTDDGLPDPPGAVAIAWSKFSGPGGVVFGNAGAPVTTASFSIEGSYVLRLTADDGALSAFDDVTVTVNPEVVVLPPDPEDVAPELDRSVSTNVATATAFIYAGDEPIQTGVAPGTIDSKRAALLRGRVLDRGGAALSGVLVTILNRPEFGQTLSRADGWFDLVVNGGSALTLNYAKAGFLTVQRTVQSGWQDYVIAPDVALTELDAQVSVIAANAAEMQTHEASAVADADGERQATLLFPAGTEAQMLLPDGTTQPLANLAVRATEYTVGPDGPAAMPGVLPPASGYTYAVELSVDEALAAGARSVTFSQPVVLHLENFLDFRVGMAVPVGYYDRARALWVAAPNGRVIEITGITDGLAEVDSVGTGALPPLLLEEAERAELAALYSIGQQLWRVPVDHFTPWDCNWPYAPPLDAVPPNRPPPEPETEIEDCEEIVDGSILECQNQVVGQSVPIVGTPYSLTYRSDRVPGRNRKLAISLSGPSVPDSLKRIDLEVEVAGRRFTQSFPPDPDQSTTFEWDGLDAYGRPLQGQQRATGAIAYVYDLVYAEPGDFSAAFGRVGGAPLETNESRDEIRFPQPISGAVGTFDARPIGLGGWMLTPHHSYDPFGQRLELGHGGSRSAASLFDTIGTIAGGGFDDIFFGDLPATDLILGDPRGIAFGPDGNLYLVESASPFAPTGRRMISFITPEGFLWQYAGDSGNNIVFNGDGRAIDRNLSSPRSIAFAPDGRLYFADSGHDRIRRVDPAPTIDNPYEANVVTIAGTGSTAFNGDGIPAATANIDPTWIAFGPDGTLYVADQGSDRVRRIDTDGIITTLAGTGTAGFTGDGGPAALARLRDPAGVGVGPDGSVYIADSGNRRIRRVGTNGVITTFAGTGNFTFNGEGVHRTQVNINGPSAGGFAFGADGSVFYQDSGNRRVRRIDADGIVTTVAGSGQDTFNGDGIPARRANTGFGVGAGIALSPDDVLHFTSVSQRRVRTVRLPIPGYSNSDLLIPDAGGRLLYEFDGDGKLGRTRDALTGGLLLEFAYDGAGRLASITEKTGGIDNVTTIQRDGSGNPTKIIAPFGQETLLAVDANGFLQTITNPAAESIQIASTADGLLQSWTDPRSHTSHYAYDADGRLTQATDPVGGTQNFERTESATGYSVMRTTALGRTTTYEVARTATGDRLLTTTLPGGESKTLLSQANETYVFTQTDGTVTTTVPGPDPRFGMQSPIVSSAEVTVPGGPTFTSSSSSQAELSDPADPLSLISLADTITVDGRTALSEYTAISQTLVETSPEGRVTTVIFDDLGRVVSRQFADLAGVTATYSVLGQLETLVVGSGPDARTSTFSYGTEGFRNAITDPLGRVATYTRDAAGRITAKVLPGSVDILYSYDAAGDLDGLTPPGQPEHTFAYTPQGQLQSVTPPAVPGSGSTTFTYNADRHLTGIARPGGEGLTLSYDDQARIQQIDLIEGGVAAASYIYSYLSANRVDTITGPDTQTVSYDYLGDLVTAEHWAGIVEGSVEWTYDSAYRLASESVSGGATVPFVYDDDDLLTAAGDFSIVRSAVNGLAQSATLGLVSESFSYNGFGEAIASTVTANAAPVYSIDLTRDDLGRITQKTETIGGVTDTYDFDYDPRDQLVVVMKNNVVIESYAYDDNGNRLNATVKGASRIGNYDDQDRLVAYGGNVYAYSPSGRLMARTEPGDLVTTYDYDAVGNLRGVVLPDATEVSYGLDGLDRRVERAVDSAVTQRFLYDGILPVAELDALGNVVSQFVYTGGHVPVYVIRAGVDYRLVTDQVGSVRLAVNAATGAIVQRLDYDSFGNVLLDTNPGFQPFGFAGGLYDPLTGLTLFGSRDYDPHTGRWTAKDPTAFRGGDTNLYRYANNNPINFIDPTGTDWFDTVLGFFNGLNEGIAKLVSPYLLVKGVVEPLADWALGDWLDEHDLYRDPYPGMLFPPPPGVHVPDYMEGNFYGGCTAAVASLPIGGSVAGAGKLGSLGGKLKDIPKLAKGIGNGLKPAWDEASKLGKKALDEVMQLQPAKLD